MNEILSWYGYDKLNSTETGALDIQVNVKRFAHQKHNSDKKERHRKLAKNDAVAASAKSHAQVNSNQLTTCDSGQSSSSSSDIGASPSPPPQGVTDRPTGATDDDATGDDNGECILY